MNNLVEFLTSKEIIIVYMISGLACLLSIIYYFIQRNNEKLKQRHNTRELNKLVEQIKEETKDEVKEEKDIYDTPILEVIDYGINEEVSVSEMLDKTNSKEEKVLVFEDEEEELQNNMPIDNSDIYEDTNSIDQFFEEPVMIEVVSVKEEKLNKVEEIKYVDVESDQATAKIELNKIQETLEKQENIDDSINIALTNYEVQQEENAIISLEELISKSREMYQANELTQYADEGNEPISLADLEKKMGEKTANIEDTFIIENVVPKEELDDDIEDMMDRTIEVPITQIINEDKSNDEVIIKQEVKNASNRFHSSPIISPIYGIEKVSSDIELENTADYDKLDEEIKKTNEFLMTLKELQNKLD